MKDRLVQLADRSEIIKLGTYLQTRHELSFLQVSRLLDLKSGQWRSDGCSAMISDMKA